MSLLNEKASIFMKSSGYSSLNREEMSSGTLFVMDRGFIDDDNFGKMDTHGIYFITPLKRDSKIPDYSLKQDGLLLFQDMQPKLCHKIH